MTNSDDTFMEIWNRLCTGEPLQGLGIARIGNRLDLRNLHLPEAKVISTTQMPFANVNVLKGMWDVQDASWRSVDFSSSRLPNLRWLSCQIGDCLFDRCRFDDLRVWGTDFSNVSFCSAYMRRAALGGVSEGRVNTFRHVDFTSADMRGTAWDAAEFVGCTFKNTKLDEADFQSSSFRDCVFEGELREVVFNRRGFRGEAYPPNEMKGVDFRRAKLRFCEFRGLDLKDVQLPEDDDHIVIRGYPEAITRLLGFFGNKPDLGSRQISIVLRHELKWLGARELGLFHKDDIREMAGEEGLEAFMKLIGNDD